MNKAINITIKYDKELQKITGVPEEPCILGEGSTYLWLLQNIDSAHPEIFIQYPPGKIGFLVNNVPITGLSILMNGDVMELVVVA